MIPAENGIFRTRDFPMGLWNEANKYRMCFSPLPLIFAKTVYRKKTHYLQNRMMFIFLFPTKSLKKKEKNG